MNILGLGQAAAPLAAPIDAADRSGAFGEMLSAFEASTASDAQQVQSVPLLVTPAKQANAPDAIGTTVVPRTAGFLSQAAVPPDTNIVAAPGEIPPPQTAKASPNETSLVPQEDVGQAAASGLPTATARVAADPVSDYAPSMPVNAPASPGKPAPATSGALVADHEASRHDAEVADLPSVNTVGQNEAGGPAGPAIPSTGAAAGEPASAKPAFPAQPANASAAFAPEHDGPQAESTDGAGSSGTGVRRRAAPARSADTDEKGKDVTGPAPSASPIDQASVAVQPTGIVPPTNITPLPSVTQAQPGSRQEPDVHTRDVAVAESVAGATAGQRSPRPLVWKRGGPSQSAEIPVPGNPLAAAGPRPEGPATVDQPSAMPMGATKGQSGDGAVSSSDLASGGTGSGASPDTNAPPVIPLRAGRLGNDIGLEIGRRISAKASDVIVRLSPEHLGRVEVRMTFEQEGAVRAVVSADDPTVLDMLKREAGDLSRALADAGVRPESQTLIFDIGRNAGGQIGSALAQQALAAQSPDSQPFGSQSSSNPSSGNQAADSQSSGGQSPGGQSFGGNQNGGGYRGRANGGFWIDDTFAPAYRVSGVGNQIDLKA